MFLIWISWLGLFVLFSAVGLFARRLVGFKLVPILWGRQSSSKRLDFEDWLVSFWMGYAVTLIYLQVWHFVFKIDKFAFIPLLLLGGAGVIMYRKEILRSIQQVVRQNLALIVLILVVGLWLSNRAIGEIQPYDTGLYHLPLIHWFGKYPLIPGLGNVHSRFAFNNSHLLYGALMDIGPFWQKPYHLANGLLLFALTTQVIWSYYRLFVDSTRQIYYFFYALLLPAILLAAYGDYFVSVSPDLVIFCLGIILSGQLLKVLLSKQKEITLEEVLFITIIAFTGITVKMSFLALGIGALLILLWKIINPLGWLTRHNNFEESSEITTIRVIRKLALVLSLGVLILLPWMVRGVVMSGYLVYPSTVFGFSVPWRIPEYIALSDLNWIASWARNPGPHWGEVLFSQAWLQQWLDSLPQELMQPLILTIVGIFLIVVLPSDREKVRQARPLWGFLLPALASCIFGFITAPTPRFIGASMWILAAGTLAFMVDRIRFPGNQNDDFLPHVAHSPNPENSRTRSPRPVTYFDYKPLLFLLVSFSIFLYVQPLKNPIWLARPQTEDGLRSVPVVELTKYTTESGLLVKVPLIGERCWYAPLPCVPEETPGLYALEEGNIRRGFAQVFSLPDPPKGFTVSPGLGVELIAGWYPYKEPPGIRWSRTPSVISIYTHKSTPALIALTPYLMNTGEKIGQEGILRLTLNGSQFGEFDVRANETLQVPVQLRVGFNLLAMNLEAGNIEVPDTVFGSVEQTRWVSIAFSRIEITPNPE